MRKKTRKKGPAGKRVRRTQLNLENDVNNAINSLIEEAGFQNVTLTGIAQKARIEPAVFYRRYANLESLFDEYTRKYDTWLSNLIELVPDDLNEEKSFKWIIKNISNELFNSKAMQQILLWELSTDNDITRRTSENREISNLSILNRVEQCFENSKIDIHAISAILMGGIYYSILTKGKTTFCTIDFTTKSSKYRLEKAMDQLAGLLFECKKKDLMLQKIAKRLRSEGISEEIIQKCVRK